MASLVSRNPSIGGEGGREGVKKSGRLPELSPVKEEGTHSSTPSPSQTHATLNLQPVTSLRQQALSNENLMEVLGLAGADEASLNALLSTVRGKVMSALGELQAITTHDDNLERQYREAIAENTELLSALEKARREIRHLRGQLSILQMTSSEIREERARRQLRERKRAEHEREVQTQRSRSQYADDPIPVLTVMERARTVNARGEYVDHRHSVKKTHSRRSTYPQSLQPLSHHTHHGPKAEPLPPPLSGCSCSVCHAHQSLGALTLGKTGREQQVAGQQTKSGQQIILGDRVIVKGEKPGTVRYIGKLEFDVVDLVYIGIHLDLPVGTCDGSLKARRYFQCPPNHGVFVRPSDVICVTGRKPHSGGTTVPRVRERIPTGLEISRTASRASKSHTPLESRSGHAHTVSPSPHSSRTTPSIIRAQNTLESELALLRHRDPNELVNESVAQMSERMTALSIKSKRKAPPPKAVQPYKGEEEPTPTEPHPPPRPHAPEPPSPLSTPSPPSTPAPLPAERAPTPLSASLLHALTSKDLGSTGFVTATELAASLMQLPGGKALTAAEVEQLFVQLGVDTSEGVGIPYHQTLPQITHAIEQLREQQP